jgi:hypothetical protein
MGRASVTDKMHEHEAWPSRAIGLAVLGAVFAILFQQLLGKGPDWDGDTNRASLAGFLAVSGFAFAFTVERTRWLWSALFALVAGLTVALIFRWQGSPDGWAAGDEWRVFSALLVVAIAAPLFQAARDEGRLSLAPAPIHRYVWSNVILWGAAWAFVLVSVLLVHLLAELFLLIGISFLRETLRQEWVLAAIIGAALGGAIGLLRDRDRMLALFQRVATTILSVLAPVLAVGLVLFVAALPFTGLQPLWETTRATTPVLLSVIAGAFILANAVLGNAPDEEARARLLRWSALALALVMVPLASVAAISTWLRVDQYGFTPERLWALVFVGLVLLIALTYAWAALRGRADWSGRIRLANVRLAFAACAVGLFLAMPILDFGAISTRDQLARLQAGQVPPAEFDWAALRFDFGPAGRRALERLGAEGAPPIREAAARALAIKDRYVLAEQVRTAHNSGRLARKLRVVPAGTTLPPPLMTAVARLYTTCSVGPCTVLWSPPAREALVLGFPCTGCQAGLTSLVLDERNQWSERSMGVQLGNQKVADHLAQLRAAQAGQIELRPVQRRQVFLGGEAVGPAF